jgi:hypothetical protein
VVIARSAIQWGDAGEWVAAIATVIALFIALYVPSRQRRIEREDAARDAEHRDLDETRRLLFIALDASAAGVASADLSGTLAHALARHSELLPADEATTLMAMLRSGRGADEVNHLIAMIDARLRALDGPRRRHWRRV